MKNVKNEHRDLFVNRKLTAPEIKLGDNATVKSILDKLNDDWRKHYNGVIKGK